MQLEILKRLEREATADEKLSALDAGEGEKHDAD